MGRKSRVKKESRRQSGEAAPETEPSRAPSPFLRIAITFALLVVVLELIVVWVIDWMPLQLATARVTADLLRLTGLPVVDSGIHLTLPNAQWKVISDCLAPGAQVVFLSFVLAYPAPGRARALAAGTGIPFLFAANIVRLVALGWLTALSPTLAGYCHDFVWQIGFLLLVVGMWLVWIEWIVKREKHPAVSA